MKLTVEDIKVSGKKVLVRCDFNVPLNDKLEITDENRIVGALPTIKYLIENGAKVIINYDDTAVEYEGNTIEALSYKLIEGGAENE